MEPESIAQATEQSPSKNELAIERDRRRYMDRVPKRLTPWYTRKRRRLLVVVVGVVACLAVLTLEGTQ